MIIKFRAWDWQKRRMIPWKELVRDMKLPLGAFFCEQIMTNPPKPILYVMQFTGLYDKKGEQIYQGDIVISEMYKGFNEPQMVNIESALYCEPFQYYMSAEDFEVIGNVYENPELLEKIK